MESQCFLWMSPQIGIPTQVVSPKHAYIIVKGLSRLCSRLYSNNKEEVINLRKTECYVRELELRVGGFKNDENTVLIHKVP